MITRLAGLREVRDRVVEKGSQLQRIRRSSCPRAGAKLPFAGPGTTKDRVPRRRASSCTRVTRSCNRAQAVETRTTVG